MGPKSLGSLRRRDHGRGPDLREGRFRPMYDNPSSRQVDLELVNTTANGRIDSGASKLPDTPVIQDLAMLKI